MTHRFRILVKKTKSIQDLFPLISKMCLLMSRIKALTMLFSLCHSCSPNEDIRWRQVPWFIGLSISTKYIHDIAHKSWVQSINRSIDGLTKDRIDAFRICISKTVIPHSLRFIVTCTLKQLFQSGDIWQITRLSAILSQTTSDVNDNQWINKRVQWEQEQGLQLKHHYLQVTIIGAVWKKE